MQTYLQLRVELAAKLAAQMAKRAIADESQDQVEELEAEAATQSGGPGRTRKDA
ncbi:hypothetical protein L917_08581 [Phytophthora nicotianae]|uniref:Uncharacterized protein n=1 Tax=Phytophthora nicotianae TaxID=4792 RepID=W2L793_PHYNI|nr:hypothetical protein L915_08750 [Phytophthora nicotianae]ETL40058.1 hypothetical protein L916_08679 [Phytophthora nicotianae]ETL93212.1 hypothetical protein L917_08581 [Phytophthora nicotianae]